MSKISAINAAIFLNHNIKKMKSQIPLPEEWPKEPGVFFNNYSKDIRLLIIYSQLVKD